MSRYSRLSELVGSRVGLLFNAPVATGKEEREPLSVKDPPLVDRRREPEGLRDRPMCALGDAGDSVPGIGCGASPMCGPGLAAACGTMSGFGMVVPTDCFGARPALDRA